MSESGEFSKGGSPIYRHSESKEFKMARGSEKNIEAISAHIEKHLGSYVMVGHEIVSHLVHIDVHIVPPSEERPCYALVTSGMSDKPMTVPEGAEELRYAELMICLPPDWPMEESDWKHERNYWPVEQLKFLARMPHEYDTFLAIGHTIPNGDPPEPLGNSKFCCALIGPACQAPEGFDQLKMSDDKIVNFYGVFLLYEEEMQFKLNEGIDALWERLEAGQVSELVDLQRKNVAK